MKDRLIIPHDQDQAAVRLAGRQVLLTNLRKPFWEQLGLTKRDLLQYYADVSAFLLPHLARRAIVMKRYPNGAQGEFFYMKRAPTPRPDWVQVCSIPHRRGNIIDFPMVHDLPTLLWLINLGCIDVHPWYARCDDYNRPDFLNFDLDPVTGTDFQRVCETAIEVHSQLTALGLRGYAKTSGSKGIHIYVPIVRKPLQKDVWTVAKTLAQELEARHPKLITAEYRVAKRPRGRVFVDYNQNAWGRTLASVYSVRPTRTATVSLPVTWDEIRRGIQLEDFRIDNASERLEQVGDLWHPLLGKKRCDLGPLLSVMKRPSRAQRVRKSVA
jgi:bifunctional non-homologous end joining protein LigD